MPSACSCPSLALANSRMFGARMSEKNGQDRRPSATMLRRPNKAPEVRITSAVSHLCQVQEPKLAACKIGRCGYKNVQGSATSLNDGRYET